MDPHFPPEIWRNIFAFATFTATSLNVMDWDPWPYVSSPETIDPALCYRSTLPTKKALTLVSKKFREMSLVYLFELVQLFHTRNAELLLDTILSHTSDTDKAKSPAKWISYIIVSLEPKPDIDYYSVDRPLMKIFPFCRNLAAFGLNSIGRLMSIEELDRSAPLLASLPLTITTLQWQRISLERSFQPLRNRTALRNFYLANVITITPEDGVDVAFPFIAHLDVRMFHTIKAASRWDLPSVSHLTLDWCNWKHVERLLSKCRNSIRSIHVMNLGEYRNDDFPRILASVPKLQTFSYGVDLKTLYSLPNSWLDVGHHESLTHVYIFCRPASTYMDYTGVSFSTIRDFFFAHLRPLIMRQLMPLTISIMNTQLIFERVDFWDDGYGAAAKQRFFDDLSASLSSSDVQFIVK
ncbi:hypothetical protein BD410DRAFT_896746 [Rickenella mellea]|uniref:F-box domain-containing protein n=1 Tax=Rickenella mellea TaxID=50990 RepID=A0A4Y7QCH5_9AGAM|nr:hypothetical protein BD410DRAFT_896746 [Rickenella mellea]